MSGRSRPGAAAIRSQFVLELAAGLVADADQPMRQARVLLRAQGSSQWPLSLFASSTREGVEAVVGGEAALALINPSAALTLAYRGRGGYDVPQPVRVLTVIPSLDRCVLAVSPATGLASVEEIAARRFPLRIGVRAQADHELHPLLEALAGAAGFSLAQLASWGGGVRRVSQGPPRPGSAAFAAVEAGEIDAIFDEGIALWLGCALTAGMTPLRIGETTLAALETLGYRRAVIPRESFPELAEDLPALDFSGWPVFVHAELDDALVGRLCRALVERRELIPWEGEGPLPLERMWLDAADTPRDVPLHPAAETFWRALKPTA